jgi:hypothetical protein
MERNTCSTYFKIVGDFNPDEISKILNLTPEKTWKIGDLRRNGTKYDFSHWEIGRCSEYDPIVDNQMRKTISILQDKIPQLNQIREKFDVEFFLEVVPKIYAGGVNPCLSQSLDVIDFCHGTRTQIDVDMYIYDSTDE